MSIRERHSLKQTVKLLSLWCWKRVCAHGQTRAAYPRLEPRDIECAAKLKKRTLTNLYNERPAWLDLAHKKLDATVAAYGWNDFAEILEHTGRVKFTISTKAAGLNSTQMRKDLLRRWKNSEKI